MVNGQPKTAENHPQGSTDKVPLIHLPKHLQTFMIDQQQIAEFAKELALEAGALVADKWKNSPLTLTSKGFRDVVTDADFASQKLITDRVRQTFPTHGFLSEEDDGSLPTEGDVIWVIDPIDGTSNFSRKSPLFSVSIAAATLTSDPNVFNSFVGVVLDPLRNELFEAQKGKGATLNGEPIQVSSISDFSNAIIALDWPRDPQERERTLNLVSKTVHESKTMRSIGSAALALSYIACGRLDAYFNLNLQPWDVAAAGLIIEEAGGRFSNISGGVWRIDDKSSLGTNGTIHQKFIDLIQ